MGKNKDRQRAMKQAPMTAYFASQGTVSSKLPAQDKDMQPDAQDPDSMGCWPPEVLGRVLFHPLPIPSVDDDIEYGSSTYKRNLVRKDHAAAFSVCKAFGKALLTVCRRFSAKLDSSKKLTGILSALRLVRDAGTMELDLSDFMHGKPLITAQAITKQYRVFKLATLLTAMKERGLVLPSVTSLTLKAMVLDFEPTLLTDLFPSLTHLHIHSCSVPPLNRTTRPILSTLPPLQHLTLTYTPDATLAAVTGKGKGKGKAGTSGCEHLPSWLTVLQPWEDQLKKLSCLATLPSLTLGRGFACCVGAVADALRNGTALTRLAVYTGSDDRDIEHLTQGGLSMSIEQLTSLRELTLSTKLMRKEDSKGTMSAVAGLPHLTRLTWDAIGEIRPWYSLADAPAKWQVLTTGLLNPLALTKLPLKELRELHYAGLVLHVFHGTKPEHIEAAITNLRSGGRDVRVGLYRPPVSPAVPPLPFLITTKCVGYLRENLHNLLMDRNTPTIPRPGPLIAACGPLIPPEAADDLHLDGLRLDGAALAALAAAVPAPIRRLTVKWCFVEPDFWPTLAKVCPQLEHLSMRDVIIHPHVPDVCEYFHTAVKAGQKSATVEFSLQCRDPEEDDLSDDDINKGYEALQMLKSVGEICSETLGVECCVCVRVGAEDDGGQWDRALLQVPGTEGLTDFCYAQINDRKRTIDEDGFESWHIDGGDEFWFGDEEGEGSEEGGDVEYDDDFLAPSDDDEDQVLFDQATVMQVLQNMMQGMGGNANDLYEQMAYNGDWELDASDDD